MYSAKLSTEGGQHSSAFAFSSTECIHRHTLIKLVVLTALKLLVRFARCAFCADAASVGVARIDVVNEEDALAFVQAAGNDEDAAAMDES